MIALLANAFTLVAVLAGLVFLAAGTVGLLRFPDPASRLHALTKVDALGLGLIVLGLLPQAEGLLGALKLLLVWGLTLLASATVGPLIARHARPGAATRHTHPGAATRHAHPGAATRHVHPGVAARHAGAREAK